MHICHVRGSDVGKIEEEGNAAFLQKAIIYMLDSYLSANLITKGQAAMMLEDMAHQLTVE
jgi:hypothetical protein